MLSLRPIARKRQFCLLFVPMLVALGQVALGQGNSEDADALFRNLDTNKDGKLTSADATANNRRMIDQVFGMAGKQASGTVTRAEFQQVFDRHRGGRGAAPAAGPEAGPTRPVVTEPRSGDTEFPAFLRLVDANSDQKLTRAEWNRIGQLFERLDANKDGSVDAAELRVAAEAAAGSANSDPRPMPTPANRSRESSERSTGDASQAGSRLAGIWRGWVVDGRGENPNTGQMEIELTIEGNRITGREVGTRRAPEGIGDGTFVMTGTGNGASGNLDADGTSGPQDGRHFQGIYELQGDTLRWCVANRGRQRPQAMATDRGNYLMVLHRQPTRN